MKPTKDEEERISLNERWHEWAEFCWTSVGSTGSRMGDAVADAFKRAVAKLFGDGRDTK
jgi:hypothetical protein